VLIVSLVFFLRENCIAQSAWIWQSLWHSASTTQFSSKLPQLDTPILWVRLCDVPPDSQGTAGRFHVSQITLIGRPVIISSQTRQRRFSSRVRHCRNSSTRRKMFSFSSWDNLIEQATVMAKHPFVPIAAQSGRRRIGVSVKTLASLFARKSLAKRLAKSPFRAPDGPTVQLISSLVTAISTLVCEIDNAEPTYGGTTIYV
jgi:hypothetical protein